MNLKRWIILGGFCIIYLITYNAFRKYQLKNNAELTYAKIVKVKKHFQKVDTDYSFNGPSHNSSISIRYVYLVQGKTYKGSYTIKTSDFLKGFQISFEENDSVLIKYSTKFPSISKLDY
jgi:hypothetical protein